LTRAGVLLLITTAVGFVLAGPAAAEPHNECHRDYLAVHDQADKVAALLQLRMNLQNANLPVPPWLNQEMARQNYSLGMAEVIMGLCRDA
jgi:hypothetical protein